MSKNIKFIEKIEEAQRENRTVTFLYIHTHSTINVDKRGKRKSSFRNGVFVYYSYLYVELSNRKIKTGKSKFKVNKDTKVDCKYKIARAVNGIFKIPKDRLVIVFTDSFYKQDYFKDISNDRTSIIPLNINKITPTIQSKIYEAPFKDTYIDFIRLVKTAKNNMKGLKNSNYAINEIFNSTTIAIDQKSEMA
jgi:hypothetical protein